MKEKHNLKNEFIQLFIINLEIGNEDIFKILHLVSDDFGNADSRTHLFTAFEKYFSEQNQDCHATGAFYGILYRLKRVTKRLGPPISPGPYFYIKLCAKLIRCHSFGGIFLISNHHFCQLNHCFTCQYMKKCIRVGWFSDNPLSSSCLVRKTSS